MGRKVLPDKPALIDDFRLREYFDTGKSYNVLTELLNDGDGCAVELLVTDRLIRKKYNCVSNPKRSDFYDCVIDGKFVEIRRDKPHGGCVYLYMGTTSGKKEYDKRKEKILKLMNGGYILTRVLNKGSRLLMYYFPTLELIKMFGDDCFSSTGININRVNEAFNLNIPLVG